MRRMSPRWRAVARWLVLWPLWERQRWPYAARVAAAATTGVIGLVLVVVIASAVGGGGGREPSEQVQQSRAPSPSRNAFPSPVASPSRGASPSPPPGPTSPAPLRATPISPVASSSPPPGPTSLGPSMPTPSYPLPAGAECIPARPPEAATLVRVVDGDTIEVSVDGRTATVRYIGVNTPERGQPYYQEATDANRRLLGDGRLLLYKDVSETDRYGRLLRYVVAGDRFVNLELVKAGYAQAATYPPDVACSQAFVAAEREARSAQVGLWAPAPVASQPTSTQAPPPAPGPSRQVQIVSVTSPVAPGGTATLTAQAWPGASCSISYVTPAGNPSTAQGLTPKTAGSDGFISWTWVIGSRTRPGTGQVTVTCDGVSASTAIEIR
jgi:endonuclease YncB( thermonuclease family)